MSRRRALGLLGSVALVTGLGLPERQVAAVAVAPDLQVRPRAAWAGDLAPVGSLQPEADVRFLLVHHTASANGADPVTVMRSAYAFHTGPSKGWPDVAYNFFIDQFGVVWEGRQGSLAGPVEASATGGSQGFAQLVCLLGDFTSELPTNEAITSLHRTLAWLADRHGIDTSPGATTRFVSRGSNLWPAGSEVTTATISGHRDVSSTACPGDTFYPYLVANAAAAVTAQRHGAAGAPPLPATPPATTGHTNAAPAPTSPPAELTVTTPTEAPPATTSTMPPSSTTAPATTAPVTTAPTTTAPATSAPSAIAGGSASGDRSLPGAETGASASDELGRGRTPIVATALVAAAVLGGAATIARRRHNAAADRPLERAGASSATPTDGDADPTAAPRNGVED